MLRLALVFCSLLLISSSVLAQDAGSYYGITLGSSEYDEPGYNADMPTITGRLGYDMGYRQFSVGGEVRLGHGGKGTYNDVDIQMTWLASALVKASWGAMDRVMISAYAGYTKADTKATTTFGSSKITEGSASYGLSLDLYANAEHGLNFEWFQLLDGNMRGADYTVDYIGVGYFSQF